MFRPVRGHFTAPNWYFHIINVILKECFFLFLKFIFILRDVFSHLTLWSKSPFLQADSSLTSQGSSCVFITPKVLYRIHNSLPLVHVLPSFLFTIYFNTVPPFTPSSFKLFFPTGFPTKTQCISLVSNCHILLDLITQAIFGEEYKSWVAVILCRICCVPVCYPKV